MRAFGLTVAAFCWALALVVGAVVVPVYSGKSSAGGTSSATLVGENGLGVLVPVAIPALVAAVVWFALHRVCSRGSGASLYVAWSLIALMGLFSLLAAASIGMFVLPVALLLAAAAVLTPTLR